MAPAEAEALAVRKPPGGGKQCVKEGPTAQTLLHNDLIRFARLIDRAQATWNASKARLARPDATNRVGGTRP